MGFALDGIFVLGPKTTASRYTSMASLTGLAASPGHSRLVSTEALQIPVIMFAMILPAAQQSGYF
jgi:hypothetical protein